MILREKAAEEINAALKQFHGALEAIAKLEAERESDADVIEGLQKIAAEQKAENAKLETEAVTERARAEELRDQPAVRSQYSHEGSSRAKRAHRASRSLLASLYGL